MERLGDWLGTGTIAAVDGEFYLLKMQEEFVHKLRLKNQQLSLNMVMK
jgi:hypothetical protein